MLIYACFEYLLKLMFPYTLIFDSPIHHELNYSFDQSDLHHTVIRFLTNITVLFCIVNRGPFENTFAGGYTTLHTRFPAQQKPETRLWVSF